MRSGNTRRLRFKTLQYCSAHKEYKGRASMDARVSHSVFFFRQGEEKTSNTNIPGVFKKFSKERRCSSTVSA